MRSDVCQPVVNTQPSTKTVLLVEDDAAISELLVQIITQETPYHVFAVPDGPQALDFVKNVSPNLLLLDYWLPTTHGIELYDRLSMKKGLERLPTIMLSVNPPLQEIKKRKIAYMKKPFDVNQFLQLIEEMIA